MRLDENRMARNAGTVTPSVAAVVMTAILCLCPSPDRSALSRVIALFAAQHPAPAANAPVEVSFRELGPRSARVPVAPAGGPVPETIVSIHTRRRPERDPEPEGTAIVSRAAAAPRERPARESIRGVETATAGGTRPGSAASRFPDPGRESPASAREATADPAPDAARPPTVPASAPLPGAAGQPPAARSADPPMAEAVPAPPADRARTESDDPSHQLAPERDRPFIRGHYYPARPY